MSEECPPHEWRILPMEDREHLHAFCIHCPEALFIDEIERRLNAAECLSAEDAEEIHASHNGYDTLDKLLKYAKLLRGL